MISTRLIAFALLLPPFPVLGQPPATPGDWPGWRGADRTGVSTETGLLREWPKDGPKRLWKATGLGGGYSTPSVAGGRLFVLGSKKEEEFLLALDIKDGKTLWSLKVGAVGENTGPAYPGPRCTPTVDGGRVYALGSDGDLVCAEAATGKLVWKRQIEKEFEGNRGTWAYCESPLIDGDVLVCTPGGEQAALLALDKRNGKVIWKCPIEDANQAGYASAVVAEVGGMKQYVQFLGSGLIGVSARDGKFLWRYKKNVGGVSAATPVVRDGLVYCTASAVSGDAGGDALLRLTLEQGKAGFKQEYYSRAMMNFHGGVVRVGEHLYGTNRTGLICVDFKTGKRVWLDRCVGHGSIMAADGHLYVRSDCGEVVLVEATPAGYREKGRFRETERSRFPTFCHPVVAGGWLYLRDEDRLLCYDVKGK